MRAVRKFVVDDEAATAIEYAFLASFVGMAIVAGLQAVGSALAVKFTIFSSALG
jgi:Flp pilus assembly pilin Flp